MTLHDAPRLRLAALGAALLAGPLLNAEASASGFYLQEQSVRGLGRANSGEVADTGPASLWWNPAAIGGEATSLALGATYIVPKGRIADAGSTIDRPIGAAMPVGGDGIVHDPVEKGLLPTIAAALRLNDQWSAGLTITSPYSFTTDYPEAGWTRYSGLKSKVRTFDIQPSIAFAPSPAISLGLGLNIEHADATLTNATPNFAPGSADGHVALDGKGWDFGWSAGVQLHPSPKLDLGLSYKSSVRHKLKGDVTVEGLLAPLAGGNQAGPVSAAFSTPWQLTGGARWHASDALTLNLQVTRFGWSKFDTIDLGAPLNSAIEQNYRNTTSVAGGFDYEANPKLILRAGIQSDATPTPRAGEPRVPDADRMMYTAGGSYSWSDRITLDAAAAYVDLERGRLSQRDVFYAGTAAETVVLLEGTTSRQKVMMVSAGARIAFR